MFKKEQIPSALRYYFKGAVHESFQSADRLDAAELTDKLKPILESQSLGYRNKLVGQAYDGASVMSGKYSGIRARASKACLLRPLQCTLS